MKYNTGLDTGSVPSSGDFTVTVNGSLRTINNVAIVGSVARITLTSPLAVTDSVTITYSVGTNPIQITDGFEALSFSNQYVAVGIITDGTPFYFSKTETKCMSEYWYTIGVIDPQTDTLVEEITSVGYIATYFAPIDHKLYVSNYRADEVTVIDTVTNTIDSVITIQQSPYDVHIVNRKLYVVNQDSDTVSVIDIDTDTVLSTISVGQLPYFGAVVGQKLYLNNRGDTVSVIDTTIDTVVVENPPSWRGSFLFCSCWYQALI